MISDATSLSLATVLREAALRYPSRTAIVDGQHEYSYKQLWREALIRAATLKNVVGVKPNDRIALLAANGLNFVAEYYAILAAGAVVVPLAPMLVSDEIEYQLRDSKVRAVVADEEFSQTALAAAERASVASLIMPTDASAALGTGQALATPVLRQPQDAAVVFYTSGTTGRPKGAVLTHANLVMNCFVNAFMANKFQSDDVVLGCLPLFHTFGQTVTMNSTFLAGGKVVLQRRFDAHEALQLMREHQVTVLIAVPTIYMALLEVLGNEPPSPLRMCVSGGAPLPVSILQRFEERFGCPVQEGYGLSETSPTATVNQTEFGFRPGSIGHPLWGIEVEVARADLTDRIELLEPDTLGEIVIRGHNVFAGYFNNTDATDAAVVDGWFRTGDLGTKDADGFRYIVDRKKDMIIRGGYNIYPRETEEVLARHPSVAQVAVLGVPDAVMGEEVLAVIVRDPQGPPVAEAELIDWTRSRIAAHKRPRIVRIVAELPLGPSRKVLKRQLRADYQDGALEGA
jgi:long-chain acyl-CoA synthetase